MSEMTDKVRLQMMDDATDWLKEFANRCWQDGIQIGKQWSNIELQKRIKELEEDANFLHALQAGGVDNWEGYDMVCEMLDD